MRSEEFIVCVEPLLRGAASGFFHIQPDCEFRKIARG
uniref:Uncharacterized protein n=1 Tax=Anguilla anguilla TaxID=7936 RepID=A0A0E9QMT5_ANGAN